MSMLFSTFTWYADQIDAESEDSVKLSILSDALQAAGDDLGTAALFFQGSTFPAWDERKTSVGPSLMYDVLATAAGTTSDTVEETVADVGDTGKACEDLGLSGTGSGQQTFGALNSDTITIGRVADRFEEVAEMSGSGSQARKTDALSDLMLSLTEDTVNGDTVTAEEQAKYIARLVLDEMRIGIGPGTVRDAIADAFDISVDSVERAIMVSADASEVAETAREHGAEGLDNMEMVVGRPVEAMLASAGEIEDAVGKWDESVAEVKYDGARLQLHLDTDNDVTLFTRGLEDVTESLPDVVEIVREYVDADEVILDSEVVAYESEDDDEPLEFTEIMKRLGRKHDIDEKRDEIAVDVHVFDILYKDGTTLITDSLVDRHEHLDGACPALAADRVISDDPDDLKALEAEALASGNEGIMLKNPESEFSPGKRGQNWLKIKPDVETLDCVVVGGEMGEGRRAGGIGSYMLAIHGGDGELKTIGKVATGLTDERLAELHERFKPLIKSQDGKDLDIRPEIVFEVGYEEIYESPAYTSGYGLRFPRFLGVREDKRVEDADSVERVESIISN